MSDEWPYGAERSSRRTRSSALLVIALVMAGVCVAQSFGRFTYGVVLPAVRDDLLGSNRLAGLLGTINVTAYLAGTIVVAALSTRLTLVPLMRIGLCFSTGGLLLASVAHSGAVLGLALAVMGLGGAAIWIPSPRVATGALRPERRGLAAGFIGMGVGIGIVFAGRLSDGLRADQGDEYWRAIYRVEAVIGLVVLLATFALLRHDETEPPVATDPLDRRSAGFAGFRSLRRIHGWLALTIAYAAFGFMYLLVFAFLVARLEDDAGFTPGQASLMFSVVGVATIFGGLFFGPLSDRIGRRSTLVVGFAVFAGSALAILPGRQPWVALGSIGAGLAFSGVPAVIAAYVVDATDAVTYGPAYSAATLAFGAAQMVAPQVGGLIADWRDSFTLVFVLSAAVAVFGAFVSSRLPETRRARLAESQPVL